MPMRVISGQYRHRHLDYPKDNKNIRPTKDRIKEAFFSSIGNIEGKIFLDLCAGVGGIGIEAISRGCTKVYFVDNNKASLSYINKNLYSLNIQNVEVVAKDALDALKEFENKGIKFDIVYFDPPYDSDIYGHTLSYIYNNNLLSKGAIVAFEANRKIEVKPFWYSIIKEYHYGEIIVTVLR